MHDTIRYDGDESEGQERWTREEREGACVFCVVLLSPLSLILARHMKAHTLIVVVPFMSIVPLTGLEEELIKQYELEALEDKD